MSFTKIFRKSFYLYKDVICNGVVKRHNSGFSFALSEEQISVQELARKFSKEEVIPAAACYDKTGEFPHKIIKEAWKLGLMNGQVPTEYCGPGLDLFTNCLIGEELGYGCSAIMMTISICSLAQTPLILYGTPDQKREYFGRGIAEPILSAFCITELDAGSDVNAVRTTAVRKGDEFILNGEKAWIINAGFANWYFVLARTHSDSNAPANEAFTGFLIDRDTPGVQPGKKEINMGQRASDIRSIKFEDVRVPKKNIVGPEGGGFKIVMETFDNTRPLVASGATGLSRRCLEESLKYSVERKTFGVPIYSHQAIAFMLADMAIGVENSRLAYQKAAWEIDQGNFDSLSSSIAKCYAADNAVRIASDAVQIFGANGYNTEYPVEKLMRDSKTMQIYGGTSQIQRLVISRKLISAIKETL